MEGLSLLHIICTAWPCLCYATSRYLHRPKLICLRHLVVRRFLKKKNRMKLLSAIYKNFLQQNLINAQGYSTLVCPLVSTMSCRLFSKQNSSFLHWKQRCIHYYYHIIIIITSHSGTFKWNGHTVTWCIPIEKLYLVDQIWRLHLLLLRRS